MSRNFSGEQAAKSPLERMSTVATWSVLGTLAIAGAAKYSEQIKSFTTRTVKRAYSFAHSQYRLARYWREQRLFAASPENIECYALLADTLRQKLDEAGSWHGEVDAIPMNGAALRAANGDNFLIVDQLFPAEESNAKLRVYSILRSSKDASAVDRYRLMSTNQMFRKKYTNFWEAFDSGRNMARSPQSDFRTLLGHNVRAAEVSSLTTEIAAAARTDIGTIIMEHLAPHSDSL